MIAMLGVRRVYKLLGGLAPHTTALNIHARTDDQGRPWVFLEFGTGGEATSWAMDLITAGRLQLLLAALLFSAAGGQIDGGPNVVPASPTGIPPGNGGAGRRPRARWQTSAPDSRSAYTVEPECRSSLAWLLRGRGRRV